MTSTRLASLLLLVLTSTSAICSAFAPSPLISRSRSSISHLAAAASVDAESYDAYIPGETKQLAIKDLVVGSGDEAKDGQMLTVSYKGRTMTTSATQNVEKFSFKLGERDSDGNSSVMEGWQQGLPGMKVGGKRLLRIPNGELTKGGGDEDLEFEVELLQVNEGALDEFLIKNGIGANTKTYGVIALVIISALLPLLEKAGIIT